jgi:hypothetical protein
LILSYFSREFHTRINREKKWYQGINVVQGSQHIPDVANMCGAEGINMVQRESTWCRGNQHGAKGSTQYRGVNTVQRASTYY